MLKSIFFIIGLPAVCWYHGEYTVCRHYLSRIQPVSSREDRRRSWNSTALLLVAVRNEWIWCWYTIWVLTGVYWERSGWKEFKCDDYLVKQCDAMERVHSFQQPVCQISKNLSFGYLLLCEAVSPCFDQLEQTTLPTSRDFFSNTWSSRSYSSIWWALQAILWRVWYKNNQSPWPLIGKTGRTKTLPFVASVQHLRNVSLMIQCEECGMWCLLYSPRKLSSIARQEPVTILDDTHLHVGQFSVIWNSQVT